MTSSRVGIGLASGSTVPRTTTLSEEVATFILASMVIVGCVVGETRCVNVSNPDFSTVMICGSEGTVLKTNCPFVLVVVWTTWWVVKSIKETAAPWMAASEESVTVP